MTFFIFDWNYVTTWITTKEGLVSILVDTLVKVHMIIEFQLGKKNVDHQDAGWNLVITSWQPFFFLRMEFSHHRIVIG